MTRGQNDSSRPARLLDPRTLVNLRLDTLPLLERTRQPLPTRSLGRQLRRQLITASVTMLLILGGIGSPRLGGSGRGARCRRGDRGR